ncbi:MAG: hypothetical protein ABI398_12625 [Devosia sp.]
MTKFETQNQQLEHGSTILAARRQRDRDRKRAQRADAADAGLVRPNRVQRALCEALSFAINCDGGLADRAAGYAAINAALVVEVAVDILIHRFHYSRNNAVAAVRRWTAPDPLHRTLGYVPSTVPFTGQPVYKLSSLSPPGHVTR